jgi:surface polysaccharide O-acyltransferase-like enzyme
MTNDGQTSSRIEVLRFPLVVAIVFIHNYPTTIPLTQGTIGVAHNSAWVEFARFFISRGLALVTVPLFFMISGYLFFLGGWSWERYINKLRRRIHTLLIPFLFWNLATLAVFAAAQSLPQTKMYFAGTFWPPVRSFSFLDYANALCGITVNFPISFQFWFIRDLMVLVVLAPAIHFLLTRKLALPFVAALFCLWYLTTWWPDFLSSVQAAFFFTLGAYLSRPGKSISYLDKFGPWIGTIFLGFVILRSAFPESPLYLRDLMIIFGVPSVWWLGGLAVGKAPLKSLLLKMSSASFFVFAAHEPLLMILRKLSYNLLSPASGTAILALYFSIPICLIAFLVAVHRYLLKTAPSFTGFITGRISRPFAMAPNACLSAGPVAAAGCGADAPLPCRSIDLD